MVASNPDRIYSSPTFRRNSSPSKAIPEYELAPVLVMCPYCGRKFSEKAAERHIPKCKLIKARPKPPPSPSQVEKSAQKRKSMLNSRRTSQELNDSKAKLESKIKQATGGL